MSLETIVATWGYPALLVGTFLEGETILVVAGFMAHRGYLQLPWVIIFAFIGSFGGDQFFFQVGRTKGRKMIEARPHWQPAAARVRAMLGRHQIAIVLGFRFLYGLRNITPIVIGSTGYSPRRFLVLNALGAAAWAIIVACGGFLFGQALESLLAEVKKFELLILLIIVLVLGLVRFIMFLRRRRARTGSDNQSPKT